MSASVCVCVCVCVSMCERERERERERESTLRKVSTDKILRFINTIIITIIIMMFVSTRQCDVPGSSRVWLRDGVSGYPRVGVHHSSDGPAREAGSVC